MKKILILIAFAYISILSFGQPHPKDKLYMDQIDLWMKVSEAHTGEAIHPYDFIQIEDYSFYANIEKGTFIIYNKTTGDREIYPINEKRLTLTNENGKIVIKNPTTLEEITSDGNGKINIYARNFNVGSFIGTFALNHGSIDSVGELRMDVGTSITVDSNTSIKANQITILNHSDNFVNNGTITGSDAVSIVAGNTYYKELSSINNVGTIESEAGIMSFTATNSFTNTGTIQADDQILFTVGGNLTNEGKI